MPSGPSSSSTTSASALAAPSILTNAANTAAAMRFLTRGLLALATGKPHSRVCAHTAPVTVIANSFCRRRGRRRLHGLEQIIHRRRERLEVFIAFGMLRQRHQDVVLPGTGDHRRVMQPILPRAGLADDLDSLATLESLHELIVLVL